MPNSMAESQTLGDYHNDDRQPMTCTCRALDVAGMLSDAENKQELEGNVGEWLAFLSFPETLRPTETSTLHSLLLCLLRTEAPSLISLFSA